MKQQEQGLLIIGALLVGAFLLQGGGDFQAITGTGAIETDGITIVTGTPTVEWYVKDILTGQSVTPGHFKVTIAGTTTEEEATDTANASVGDAITVCLMPNSTYYGVCESGIIEKTVTKVNLDAYALASTPSIYVNNDSENSTNRNSPGVRDDITDEENMQAIVCFTGNGANQAFGPDGMLVVVDWNSQVADNVYFSEGIRTDEIPRQHQADANRNTISSWEIQGPLLNGVSICGTLTVEGVTTVPAFDGTEVFGEPEIFVVDKFLSRNSSTDALEFNYARDTDGSDTNSVTNASIVYYMTS